MFRKIITLVAFLCMMSSVAAEEIGPFTITGMGVDIWGDDSRWSAFILVSPAPSQGCIYNALYILNPTAYDLQPYPNFAIQLSTAGAYLHTLLGQAYNSGKKLASISYFKGRIKNNNGVDDMGADLCWIVGFRE